VITGALNDSFHISAKYLFEEFPEISSRERTKKRFLITLKVICMLIKSRQCTNKKVKYTNLLCNFIYFILKKKRKMVGKDKETSPTKTGAVDGSESQGT